VNLFLFFKVSIFSKIKEQRRPGKNRALRELASRSLALFSRALCVTEEGDLAVGPRLPERRRAVVQIALLYLIVARRFENRHDVWGPGKSQNGRNVRVKEKYNRWINVTF
jgi:hypothetical protein